MKSKMNARTILLALVLFLSLASTAVALELDAAKAQGLVGETPLGYLAPVKAPSPEVEALVNKVNSERKAIYLSIAEKNKTPVASVESLAGKKAMDMTAPGQYVQVADGKWVKK